MIRPPAPQTGGGGGFGTGGGNNPPKKGNVSYSNISAGDIEAGFREADHIIEYDINLPAFAGHLPDPVGSVAWWFNAPYHGEGKSLRIEGNAWGHDQVVGMYKMPPEKVFQECMLVGGRYCDWGIRESQLITPLLSQKNRAAGSDVFNSRYDQYDFNLNLRYHTCEGRVQKERRDYRDRRSFNSGPRAYEGKFHFRYIHGPDLWPLFYGH